MKRRFRVLLSLLLVMVGAARGWAAAGTNVAVPKPSSGSEAPSLFGFTNLWTLHLVITREDWQTLGSRGVVQRNRGGPPMEGILRNMFGGGEQGSTPSSGADGGSKYPWVQCTLEVGGQRLTNVAVRTKGVSSVARAPNGYKRPLKLDFDRGVKGRTFLGIDELYLNNNVNDATQMREVLAYELFRRAGLPAPRTAFARVYLTISGQTERQHLGLYTLVEAVEGRFLKRHFGERDGVLVKPEMMRGVPYLGEDWDDYSERYQPKNDPQPADTARFIEMLRYFRESPPEQFSSGVKDYLDPDLFLRFVALNAILANVDSFIGNGHNYYLFLGSASRKATFIPWDLNESFGMHPVSGPSRFQMQTSILRPNADPNPLVERFLSDPVWGPRYRAICSELLTNVFVPARLTADIDRLAAITQPVVFAETKRARADFERTVLATLKPDEGDTEQPRFDEEFARLGYRPWSFPGEVEIDNLPLKEWIRGRHVNALDQLAGRFKAPRARPRL